MTSHPYIIAPGRLVNVDFGLCARFTRRMHIQRSDRLSNFNNIDNNNIKLLLIIIQYRN